MPKFDLTPLPWGPPESCSSRVRWVPAWVPRGCRCPCTTPQRYCQRPSVDSGAVGVAPCRHGCNAARPVVVAEQDLIWGGVMLGLTLLRGSAHPWGEHQKAWQLFSSLARHRWDPGDMWGDVTAARMRAVSGFWGWYPKASLAELELSCSTGMLPLPTSTSLPVGHILAVLRVQSPLLVGSNLVPVPTGQVACWAGGS